MSNDGTEFSPDQVERQIEMLAQARQTWPGASPDTRLISDLSRVSAENEAIAQRTWQRLVDHVQHRSPLTPVSGERRALPGEQQKYRSREKRPHNRIVRLLGICAAILVVAALVASTALVLGNMRQKQTPPVATTPETASGASALYVSSPAGVYRVDPASGKVLWHYADKSSMYSQPYVVDNVVIVADDSAGPTSDSEGMVVGLDSFTGKPLWAKMIQETWVLAAGDGMIIFLDEYIPRSAPLPPLITAYQATTGQRLWSYQQHPRSGKFHAFQQEIIADGKVYAALDSQVLVLQSSSGSLLWQKTFTNTSLLSSPVVSGNTLYFVGSGSSDTGNVLFGINAAGGEEFQSQIPFSQQPGVKATLYSLTVVNGVVYVDVSVPSLAYLYAFNASNGTFLARYEQMPDTAFLYSRYPLHSVQHLIVFAMMSNSGTIKYDLVAFNTTTKTRAWSVPVEEYPNDAADFLQVANDVIYLNVGAHVYVYSLSGKLLRDYVIPVSSAVQGSAYGPFIAVVG